jgi:hypothetical protein
MGVCLWRADWSLDDLDAFVAEDFVEGGAEFAVAVVDRGSCALEDTGEAEVACLLGDPGLGRVAGAASEVDAAAASSMKNNT